MAQTFKDTISLSQTIPLPISKPIYLGSLMPTRRTPFVGWQISRSARWSPGHLLLRTEHVVMIGTQTQLL